MRYVYIYIYIWYTSWDFNTNYTKAIQGVTSLYFPIVSYWLMMSFYKWAETCSFIHNKSINTLKLMWLTILTLQRYASTRYLNSNKSLLLVNLEFLHIPPEPGLVKCKTPNTSIFDITEFISTYSSTSLSCISNYVNFQHPIVTKKSQILWLQFGLVSHE